MPIHSVTVSKQAQHRPNVVPKDVKEDCKPKIPTVLEVAHPPYPVPWRTFPLSRARDNQPIPNISVKKRLPLLCLRLKEWQCQPLMLSQFVSLDLLGLTISAVFEPSHFSSTSFRANFSLLSSSSLQILSFKTLLSYCSYTSFQYSS